MTVHWRTTELAKIKPIYEAHGAKVAAHEARRTVRAIYDMAHKQGWEAPWRRVETGEGTIEWLAQQLAVDGVTWEHLVAETGCSTSTERTTLSKLVKRGRLVNVGGRPAVYMPPDRPVEGGVTVVRGGGKG